VSDFESHLSSTNGDGHVGVGEDRKPLITGGSVAKSMLPQRGRPGLGIMVRGYGFIINGN